MRGSEIGQASSETTLVTMCDAVMECRSGNYQNLQLVIDYVMQNGLSTLHVCFGLKKSEYDAWLFAASFATFTVGQLVQWSPYGLTDEFVKQRESLGGNVFLIEKVESLSSVCTCGELIERNGNHWNDCDCLQARLHPQRLTLLTPKGTFIVSGLLFRPTK